MHLVTGATGHLGNVLVRKLLERGERVRILVLPGESLHAFSAQEPEVIVGNILDRDLVERAAQGIDTVYHLAGVISILPGSESLMDRINVSGTRNIVDACLKARVRRLVHVSSCHAFRREPHGVTMDEETPLAEPNCPHAYDRTKADGSRVVLEAAGRGLDAVIVCPTGIIGPHDYLASEMGSALASFAGKKLHFLVKGAFDFVDVRDAAEGLILAAQKGRPGETYLLTGNRVTLENLWQQAQQSAGRRSPRLMVPFKLAMVFSGLLQHVYRLARFTPRFTPYSLQTVADNSSYSCAKAAAELGFTSRPLRESVADYLAWRRDHRRGKRGRK
jgi:dihydroflavonol-4-reductase